MLSGPGALLFSLPKYWVHLHLIMICCTMILYPYLVPSNQNYNLPSQVKHFADSHDWTFQSALQDHRCFLIIPYITVLVTDLLPVLLFTNAQKYFGFYVTFVPSFVIKLSHFIFNSLFSLFLKDLYFFQW